MKSTPIFLVEQRNSPPQTKHNHAEHQSTITRVILVTCTVQDKTTILIINICLLVLDEMRKLHEAYQLCRKMMQKKRIRNSVNGRKLKMKNGKSKVQTNKDI